MLLTRGNAQGRGDLAGCSLFDLLEDVGDTWEVSFDSVDDLLVYVRVVIESHPLVAQALTEEVGIEGELHEDVHLRGLLAHDQLPVVRSGQLVQAEEAEVGEDLVQDGIVAVRTAGAPFKEDFGEYLCEAC